jgi:cysteine-S-conjugate beta-lyase
VTIDLTVASLDELHRRRSEKWSMHPPDVLSSTIAEMDFPVAEPVARALREAIDRDDLGYAPPLDESLRRAFAAFAARRLAWAVDPEQVTVVPDVMLGLLELCRVIAGPGDAIAFASPAYPPFYELLPRTGARLVHVALHDDGRLDLGSLDEALSAGSRALVLASPHNPTGHVSALGELAAIAERCAEHGVWVLADEIHAPLTLPGATFTAWLEVSDAAREIGVSLTSASKAFNVAGLKSALVVTASEHSRDLVAGLGRQHEHSGLLGAIAAEAAFTDGDPWLDAVLAQLDSNRAWLTSELPARLPGIAWRPPQATYLAWLDCTGLGLGNEPADVFLRRGRVALSRGLDYGPEGAGHVRLNFATSPEHLDEALTRMRAGQAMPQRRPDRPAAN